LRPGLSNNEILNQLRMQHDSLQLVTQNNIFYEQLGAIYYHLIDYDLDSNMKLPAKYHQDLLLKEFSSKKPLQRLWLNSDHVRQKLLPEKVMVASSNDLSADSVSTLAKNIIHLFGVGKEIFIKASGTLGVGNLHMKIEDEESLIKALSTFKNKVKA